jgi:hypothetical protein
MSFTKNGISGLLAVGLLFSPVSLWAELDKDEVDKQEAKKVLPELGGDSADYQRRLIEEGEKNLEEINKLLDQIQKGMAARQTGGAVQGKQAEVVERLDKLIENLGKCSSCSSSGGQSYKKDSQPKDQPEQQQAGSEQQQQKAGKDQQMQAQQQKSAQQKCEQEEAKKSGKVANNRTADGPPPDARDGSLKSGIEQARRWGVLPSKIADSILSSAGKEAPLEYREIISRYFKRMAEMSRKK